MPTAMTGARWFSGMRDWAPLVAVASTLSFQTPTLTPPAAVADVGAWDAALVRRAAALIATPAQWDRAATGTCTPHATRLSLQCAIATAADAAGAGQPAVSDCRFRGGPAGQWEGSCGPLFDEDSIFLVRR